jgi:hypothetical protein
MDKIRVQLIKVLLLSLTLIGISPAFATEDPFPNISYQSELPGSRIWSAPGITQSAWESSAEYLAWDVTHCPAGTGRSMGADLNFTETHSDDRWFSACIKTWQAPSIESGTVLSPSETQTVPTPLAPESSTPVSNTPPAQITTGLGGYAIIHPDGHVCGVIVATSNDPYGNGGTMPIEYMGCPIGARIIFQTTPSSTGNVAGWHGPNVIYNGTEFIITSSSSSTTINNGIAVESNGKTWDTGTGRVISIGTSETSTPKIETLTPLIETPTAIRPIASTPLAAPESLTVPTPISEDLESLPEVIALEEISNTIEAQIVNGKTRISISTEWADTRLTVVATKKGSKKKYTYKVTTNSSGDYLFKSSVNLKGFVLVLYKGAEELDREIV